MLYTICRTSDWFGENKPCEKAYLHRSCDFENEWRIEINSIEELNELINDVGKCIILTRNTIEIYDDYRE